MVKKQKSNLFFLGIYPKCPFYKSVLAIVIILALITLGTIGIYFLSVWAAMGYLLYSIVFYFLVMPLGLCKYCYFKVKDTTIDKDTGKTIEKLLSKDKWRESYLPKHVQCGKRWTWALVIVWFLPIVFIIISFFLSFSFYAALSLLGIIVVLVGNLFYMVKVKCPKCPIVDECHSSF